MGGDYYKTRLIGTPNNRSQVDAIIIIILRNDSQREMTRRGLYTSR